MIRGGMIEMVLRESATRALTFALTIIFGIVFTVGLFILMMWLFNKYIGWDKIFKIILGG
jgi:hypothetical protein